MEWKLCLMPSAPWAVIVAMPYRVASTLPANDAGAMLSKLSSYLKSKPIDASSVVESEAADHTLCAEPGPQCGLDRAVIHAVDQILAEWKAADIRPQCGNIHPQCVQHLAVEFCRDLQRFPALAGKRVHHTWVRTVYPLFCSSRGMEPPAYKGFAKALAESMPRSRGEEWRRGRRVTFTRYLVPVAETGTNVVPLAERAR